MENSQKARDISKARNIALVSLISLLFISIISFGFPGITETIRQMSLYSGNRFTPQSDLVRLVVVDADTYSGLRASGTDTKSLTISKSNYLTVIDKLEKAGVAGIAFDIVFENASNEDTNHNTIRDEVEFADAMKRYGNIVIGAMIGKADTVEQCTKSDTAKVIGGVSVTVSGGWVETCQLTRSDSLLPNPLYDSIPWGAVNAVGTTAEYRQLSFQEDYRTIKTLPLALWEATHSGSSSDIPVNSEGYMLTPFFSFLDSSTSLTDPKSLTTSFLDIYRSSGANEEELLRAKFAGKYVIIGERGTLIHDEILSPVTRRMMPWVETHANILQGIIDGRFLTPLPRWLSVLSTVFVTIALVTLFSSIRGWMVFLIGVISIIAILLLARLLFALGYVVDISSLLLAGGGLTLPISFIYRFFVADREKRYIQWAFSHYIDHRIVEEISGSGKPIELGGESREITVLFSDIEGFTTISEKNGTKKTFALMSEYLSTMTDILITNGGTLDKYIGDAIMGFFGAPLSIPDHAEKMCRTALQMQRALPAFNASLERVGIEPIRFRIGIATGEAMIGNIGSRSRFSYTALGDTVNLASRLESINKDYHTYCCVAESTYQETKELFHFRKLDLIRVKGKEKAVAIYELLWEKSEAIDMRKYEIYEEAFALYVAWDYRSAGQKWESIMGEDPSAEMMLRRCVAILRGEETVDEMGAYTMHHK